MKYRTLVIDPPWPVNFTGKRKERPNQIEMPYRTMTVAEIKWFPIDDFTAEQSHLWLWTTNGFLRDAFDVMEKWGFKYHATFVWNKPTGVCPFSFQFVNEYVLFGYRGKFELVKIGLPTSFNSPVREHSRKPDEFYRIAEAVGYAPRIDMFSRETRTGWDTWGDQVNYFKSEVSNETGG